MTAPAPTSAPAEVSASDPFAEIRRDLLNPGGTSRAYWLASCQVLLTALDAETRRAEEAEKVTTERDQLKLANDWIGKHAVIMEKRATAAEAERDRLRESRDAILDGLIADMELMRGAVAAGDSKEMLLARVHLLHKDAVRMKEQAALTPAASAGGSDASSSGQHASTLEDVDGRHTSALSGPEEAPAPAPSEEALRAADFIWALIGKAKATDDDLDRLRGLSLTLDKLAGRGRA